ncbi:MAG: SDR family oxidoreductase [Myxococcota bacterium]
MKRFQNKVAVITGASAGIGESCARKFVAEGAKVVLAARGVEALEKLANELGTDVAYAVPTDIADMDSCKNLLEQAQSKLGSVDVLVNNAGFNSRGALKDIPVEDMLQILNVNLRGPMLLTRLALPIMLGQGSGSIVGVASLAGRIPLEDEATYSATKFGLRTFSFALADELEGTGVKVSVVSPGPVETGFIIESIDEVPDIVFSQPMSTADEIADLVLESAFDGRRERVKPTMGARLATLGYLLPAMRRALKPRLEAKGRREKNKYRSRG